MYLFYSCSDSKFGFVFLFVFAEGKQEWKRYKQYSRKNISDAIEAVRGGMSALKAATQFNVPSRTLYDKVKKLGISTPRPFRRNNAVSNGSSIQYGGNSARFPSGVGGNVNGRIYASMARGNENDGAPSGLIIDTPSAAILDAPFSPVNDSLVINNQDTSTIDIERNDAASPVEHKMQIEHDDNEVEDLSINRKNDVRGVIMPVPIIKEEKIESPDNFGRL